MYNSPWASSRVSSIFSSSSSSSFLPSSWVMCGVGGSCPRDIMALVSVVPHSIPTGEPTDIGLPSYNPCSDPLPGTLPPITQENRLAPHIGDSGANLSKALSCSVTGEAQVRMPCSMKSVVGGILSFARSNIGMDTGSDNGVSV